MHKSAVGYAVGKLMQVLGMLLLVPLALAIYDYRRWPLNEIFIEPDVFGFIFSSLLCIVLGTILSRKLKEGRQLQGPREGFAIVTIGWISLTFFSALPLCFYLMAEGGSDFGSLISSFTDAYFELMSGYTTTGATILTDIEAIPRSLLFLRALSHWLGGMGIITLAIAVFPSMGVTAYSMFRSEVPGPSTDRLAPRLAQTTSVLWGVYVLLTAAETGLLWLGGMDIFDSVCHAFATMATGGFSTQNASIAAYHSDYIEWIITIFMYFAGINFLLHFRALRGDLRFMFRDREFRFYTAVIVVTIAVSTAVLYFGGLSPKETALESYRSTPMTAEQFTDHYETQAGELESFYSTVRIAAFQTLSIVTTTGFVTADFDLWPSTLTFLLVLLMFFGGCAGSTGGGIKMIRIIVVIKVAWTQIRKMSQPRLVAPVKIGDQVMEDSLVVNVVAFFILFIGLFVITSLLMTLFVPDLITAATCTIATIGNIGPGLGGVGAIENYSWIPIPGKWLLVLSMLLGRLEIFTVLIIFRPSVWRR